MRKYELMTVFTVDEEAFTTGIEAFRGVLADFGASIVSEEQLGDKNLAYEIKKKQKGRYVLFVIEAEPSRLAEMNKKFKLIPSLLTYLSIKLDE